MRVLRPQEATDTRDDPRFKPLKIVAYLANAIVSYSDPIHLDGLLAAGAFKHWCDLGGRPQSLPDLTTSPIAVDFDLPLAKWTSASPPGPDMGLDALTAAGEVWGWCASAEEAVWLQDSQVEVRKRSRIDEMVQWSRDTTVNNTHAYAKAWDVRFPAKHAHTLVFHARGIAHEVHNLLSYITHIGKLHNHGHGKILFWEVEECKEDHSIEHGGQLTRRMPVAYRGVSPREGVLASIRAPYHHPSRAAFCVEREHNPHATTEGGDEESEEAAWSGNW